MRLELNLLGENQQIVIHLKLQSTLVFFFRNTVCSAGTWRRRWPWRYCRPVRCGQWSRCFRGRVTREHFLSTAGWEPLYSDTKDTDRHFTKGDREVCKLRITGGTRGLTSLLKKDGERIYVDFWSQGKSTESGHSMLFQIMFPFCREGTGGAQTLPSPLGLSQELDTSRGKKKSLWSYLCPSLEVPKNGGDDCVLFSHFDLLPGRPDVSQVHLLPLWCHACTNDRRCFQRNP